MSNQYTMNENGLTWSRWFAAATYGAKTYMGGGAWSGQHRPLPVITAAQMKQMRAAWKGGDCPCDWAASLAG